MKARAAALAHRGRWALSFADLTLLLLGFFVLLQASNGRQHEVVGGIAEEFGSPATVTQRLAARDLFLPREAMLTSAGMARISDVSRQYRTGRVVVQLKSVGLDPAANRFDTWDLAAARLGAIARAMAENGVARDRIVIRGLDQQGDSKAGQQIIIRAQ